jgi:hypothetical protein
MELTQTQLELLGGLRAAVAGQSSQLVVYCTEYLGYLPFGLYHWFEVDEIDINYLGSDFSSADLDVLEAAGFLKKMNEWVNPDDELERTITFRIEAT